MLKKRYSKKKLVNCLILVVFVFTFLCIGVGYSYLRKDLGSTGKIIVDMKGPLIEIMKHRDIPKLDTDVDFKSAPSASNGKGLMLRNGTENDTYPIYYYRGDITNNYVKFANVIWKIVRTTEKGGVKLVYYAENGGNGNYYNNLDSSFGYYNSFDSNNKFNFYYSSIFYYPSTLSDIKQYVIMGNNITEGNTGYVYSTNMTYDSSSQKYFLSGNTLTMSGDNRYPISTNYETESKIIDDSRFYECTENCPHPTVGFLDSFGQKSYHYTCLSTETSCSQIYYIFDLNQMCNENFSVAGPLCASLAMIPLSSGQTINNYLESVFPNSTSRNAVKTTTLTNLETWYKKYLTSYSSKLEDAVWCNDREYGNILYSTFSEKSIFKRPARVWNIYGNYYQNYVNYYGGFNDNPIYFNSYYRLELGNPAVKDEEVCSNVYDRFTVSTSTGNGKLTYKLGVLTKDEAMLMGDQDYYKGFWTMTPKSFGAVGNEWYYSVVHSFKDYYSPSYPAISIVLTGSAAMVSSGTGTFEDPYIIN